MMRRGYLRSKARKVDPREGIYRREVARRRRVEGKLNTYQYQPHHLDPPHKKRLLFFVLIHRDLHTTITNSPNWARAHGWRTHIDGTLCPLRPEVKMAMDRETELLQQMENAKS